MNLRGVRILEFPRLFHDHFDRWPWLAFVWLNRFRLANLCCQPVGRFLLLFFQLLGFFRRQPVGFLLLFLGCRPSRSQSGFAFAFSGVPRVQFFLRRNLVFCADQPRRRPVQVKPMFVGNQRLQIGKPAAVLGEKPLPVFFRNIRAGSFQLAKNANSQHLAHLSRRRCGKNGKALGQRKRKRFSRFPLAETSDFFFHGSFGLGVKGRA